MSRCELSLLLSLNLLSFEYASGPSAFITSATPSLEIFVKRKTTISPGVILTMGDKISIATFGEKVNSTALLYIKLSSFVGPW